MTSARSETTISGMIRSYLNARGFTVWRNNTGVWRTGQGHVIRNGMKGSPDLMGFTPEGYFLGIEVKKPNKKITEYQKEFARMVRETDHGIYIVARSVEDVQKALIK